MSYSRNGAIGGGGSGGSEIAGSGAAGLVTLWTNVTTISADPSGTWSGTGHTFVIGSPTFNARDGHLTGPAGASVGPSSAGGGFTNQPAGDTIDLVSDDAGDTTQQVTVIGVLAGVDASENIALNGVTPVTSVGTYDLILALVLNNACTGTVTASETSGGLAITTIAPAALSAGLQTFGAIDGYGKVLQIVASGATTKTVGIGGYAIGGGIQREPVVLTGTTKVNTTNTWEGAVQFYLGDLEATRTVTLNSIAGFDFKSTGGVLEPIQTSVVLTEAGSAAIPAHSFIGDPDTGIIDSSANSIGFVTGGTERWVINASGAFNPVVDATYDIGTSLVRPRDIEISRTGTFGTSVVTPIVSHPTQGGVLVLGDSISSALKIYSDTGVYWATDNSRDVGREDIMWRTGYFGTSLISPLYTSGPGKSGTNVAGTNNTIQAEPGTGSATGSSLIFQTPTAGASGTTAQTQATRLTLDESGAGVTNLQSSGYILAASNSVVGFVGGPKWLTSTGSPEGVVTAVVGSLYSRTDGGAGTTLYVKESGSGNTGWVAK